MAHHAAPPTSDTVGRHYDEIDPFYRELWGEHLHHGLWITGRERPEEAALRLVERVVERGGIRRGNAVCDVGCGYGATAHLLAHELGAEVTGLTVSRAQYEIARARANGDHNPGFFLRDWLDNDLPPASFDAVIAIESTEHMADKPAVFAEMFRVLRPGGRLVVCAWLAADQPSVWQRRHLLDPICNEGRLAGLNTAADYLEWMQGAGFVNASAEDLSQHVRRTWPVCARRLAFRLLTRRSYRSYLLDPRNANRWFALTVLRIWLAYGMGCMRYALFVAEKPREKSNDRCTPFLFSRSSRA